MAVSDPIADNLTKIRNAILATHSHVELRFFALLEDILAVLKREGYIKDYEKVQKEKHNFLRVILNYDHQNRIP